ncbi:4-hydroxy-3-methylbut-2-enyl diphosphatereductase, partial [Striga asiatica]
PSSLRRREPNEPRGKRKRSTCPYKLKKQQATIRCSKCHETCHNALRCKVTVQNTEGLENSSHAPHQQEANANANIPNMREKLKEVQENANILPPIEDDLMNITKQNTIGVENSSSAQQQKENANSKILPPTQEDLMDSVISYQDLIAKIESQVDSNIYQYVQPHKPGPSPFEQLKMSSN